MIVFEDLILISEGFSDIDDSVRSITATFSPTEGLMRLMTVSVASSPEAPASLVSVASFFTNKSFTIS